MLVCEAVANGLFDMQKRLKWTDRQLLSYISQMSIHRHELAILFENRVHKGQIKSLAKMDPAQVEQVKAICGRFPVTPSARVELEKCCALLAQLNPSSDLFDKSNNEVI